MILDNCIYDEIYIYSIQYSTQFNTQRNHSHKKER